jgi:hypothetical protein
MAMARYENIRPRERDEERRGREAQNLAHVSSLSLFFLLFLHWTVNGAMSRTPEIREAGIASREC